MPGQHEQAIVKMTEAVKSRADGPTAYDLRIALARVAPGLGHATEAKQSFDQALAWIAKRKVVLAAGTEVDYFSDKDQVQQDILKREVEQARGVNHGASRLLVSGLTRGPRGVNPGCQEFESLLRRNLL